MRLKIRDLADHTILAGAGLGRQLLSQLIAQTSVNEAPGVVFLDFQGIRVATSSFLRESVLGFRDFLLSTPTGKYVAVANLAAPVVEELAFLLTHRGDAFWACTLNATDRPTDARLIGKLDEVHESTFRRVLELGLASAPELASLQDDEDAVGTTAWNNRLQALTSRGILKERRTGKTKVFSPVLEAYNGS